MPRITSQHNPRVKHSSKLRDRQHRDTHSQCLVEGAREILRAFEGGARLLELFYCPSCLHSPESQLALRLADENGVQLLEVSEEVYQRLAFGHRREGLIAVAETPTRTLASLTMQDAPLVLALAEIEKPGNLGAIVRTSDGAGITAVIAADPHTDIYNPNAIRASMGAVFTLPVVAASAEATLQWLRDRQIGVFAARVDGAIPYTHADFTTPCAIVLGAEAHGLSSVWSASGITSIRLPMRGKVDSLNVAATAAVLAYEALRQRDVAKKIDSKDV